MRYKIGDLFCAKTGIPTPLKLIRGIEFPTIDTHREISLQLCSLFLEMQELGKVLVRNCYILLPSIERGGFSFKVHPSTLPHLMDDIGRPVSAECRYNRKSHTLYARTRLSTSLKIFQTPSMVDLCSQITTVARVQGFQGIVPSYNHSLLDEVASSFVRSQYVIADKGHLNILLRM